MYTPSMFQFADAAAQVAFMQQYSFATIITVKDNIPLATQLPFFIEAQEGRLVLSAHFAKANEQAKYIEAQTSLVIFTGPHAYISPVHYDKRESVPTWDYMAVHAYGQAKILDSEAAKMKALEQLISFYEPGYAATWQTLTDKFKKGMLQGIVAFEIEVSDLQGQKKLSQNKTEAERHRIVEQLDQSGIAGERELAGYIRDLSKEMLGGRR